MWLCSVKLMLKLCPKPLLLLLLQMIQHAVFLIRLRKAAQIAVSPQLERIHKHQCPQEQLLCEVTVQV